MSEILLQGGLVVDPATQREGKGDVLIRDGKIVEGKATKDAVLKMIGDKETTASKVVESCFNWADIYMAVRAKRNAKT